MRRNALSSITGLCIESNVLGEGSYGPDVFNDDYRNVSALLSKVLSIFGFVFLVCSGFKWQANRGAS